MTAITTTTIVIRPWNLLASLKGFQRPQYNLLPALVRLPAGVMSAFEMAYVFPFSTTKNKPTVVLDEDMEGRDPNW